MRFAVIAALIAGVGCGRTLTVYKKTSPRRVEVAKTAGEPVLTASATRSEAGVQLRLKLSRSVRLSRTMHYNASAVIYEHSRNPANELIEIVVGVLMLAVPTAFWDLDAQIDGEDTPVRQVVRERRSVLALLDPTRSVFTNNIRIDPVVASSVFSDPVQIRDYQVSLPAADVEVAVRALDEAGQEVGRGSITTDLHGTALLFEGIPETAIALELRSGGQSLVVPIERGRARGEVAGGRDRGLSEVEAPDGPRDPYAGEPPPAEPAEPELPDPPEPEAFEHLGQRLAEVRPDAELEARWGPAPAPPRVLPRVTATLDLVPIFENQTEDVFLGQLVAEIRLLPRLSISGIFGFGNVELESVIAFALQGGAQARAYVWGDFRSGLNIGVEGLYFSFEEGAMTDPRVLLGPMVGYKHMFRIGFTAEIQAGGQLVLAGDELPTDEEGGWVPLVNLALGWSF